MTSNNKVPESDNKNIGKAATGNDFLTLWPKDQEFADRELAKAKDMLVGAALSALGLGGLPAPGTGSTTAGVPVGSPAVVAVPPPPADAVKPPGR